MPRVGAYTKVTVQNGLSWYLSHDGVGDPGVDALRFDPPTNAYSPEGRWIMRWTGADTYLAHSRTEMR